MTIYKFPLPIKDQVTLSMPKDSRVLCVQVQQEVPCIWALCDPDAEKEERRFQWFGTGQPLSDDDLGYYVGSIQLVSHSLDFHLFEETWQP